MPEAEYWETLLNVHLVLSEMSVEVGFQILPPDVRNLLPWHYGLVAVKL